MSADKDDRGYVDDYANYSVSLDGEPQRNVITADSDYGFVEKVVLCKETNVPRLRNGEKVTEVLRGKVVILKRSPLRQKSV